MSELYAELSELYVHCQEHCLMGIRGTVRRSTDGDFIHANVDIDLVIAEEEPWGSAEKPVEIFHIIEHFCLGRRRLHLFGKDTTIRPGWLTVGPDLTSTNFNPDTYSGFFARDPNAYLTGATEDIERLRPKSPPPKVKGGSSGGSVGGGGGGVASNAATPPMVIPSGVPSAAALGGPGVAIVPPPMIHGSRLAPPPRSTLPLVRGPVAWPPTVSYVQQSNSPGTMWHSQRTYLPPRS